MNECKTLQLCLGEEKYNLGKGNALCENVLMLSSSFQTFLYKRGKDEMEGVRRKGLYDIEREIEKDTRLVMTGLNIA